ncbi:MAG: glycosyltransferase [Planctomycetota bacterium]|jgi:UDP-N-acetylglucosamine transferase subunit ALG13
MMFLTVGTYPLPYDRLVKATDTAIMEGLIEEEVFAQIGLCSYMPQNMECVGMLQKEAFDSYFEKASAIIAHAGIGSIVMALEYNKPLLVMPRMKRFKEHVNDHQVATAREFERLGHLLAVYCEEDLADGIRRLKSFTPKERKASPDAVAERIAHFLNLVSKKQK